MEYLTEQEQVELLKKWIKQYGPAILGGVIMALIVVFSWRYWQEYRNNRLIEASVRYDRMLAAKAENKAQDAATEAHTLLTEYPKTPYAQMAALLAAQNAVAKKDFAEAKAQLSWVMDHSAISSIREIARLRLARVYIAEQKPEEALKTLNTVDDHTFVGLIDEVRGDAYQAANNIPAAKEAYEQALKHLPNAEMMRPLLQMKRDHLA